MNEKWFVVGEDARIKLVAKKLTDETRTVFYKKTAVWDDVVAEAYRSFQPTHIIFPIQPLKIKEPIIFPQGTKIFRGKSTPEWDIATQYAETHPYLENELFIWKNAYLTALGLLTHLLNEQIVITDKTIIISGFGRVAKMIAKLFTDLKANIIITVRSDIQLAEAAAHGYETIPLESSYEKKADFFVNTIPTRWLTANYTLYRQLPIYDVASAPGCIPEETNVIKPTSLDLVKSNGPNQFKNSLNYQLLHALPAQYFPEASAQLLYEAIIQLNKGGFQC